MKLAHMSRIVAATGCLLLASCATHYDPHKTFVGEIAPCWSLHPMSETQAVETLRKHTASDDSSLCPNVNFTVCQNDIERAEHDVSFTNPREVGRYNTTIGMQAVTVVTSERFKLDRGWTTLRIPYADIRHIAVLPEYGTMIEVDRTPANGHATPRTQDWPHGYYFSAGTHTSSTPVMVVLMGKSWPGAEEHSRPMVALHLIATTLADLNDVMSAIAVKCPNTPIWRAPVYVSSWERSRDIKAWLDCFDRAFPGLIHRPPQR